ncbi:MAG: rhomboid family intramembrane serine protease [Fuerstiella sp.]|nr:rhomboid family intramembrane serine protease [Fuerstiella sp.]
MIPLRDNIRSRTTPWINYTIIAVCCLVFYFQLQDQKSLLVERYGMIPTRIVNPDQTVDVIDRVIVQTPFGDRIREISRPVAPAGVIPWLTTLTCIFLHGGWMHIIGNMWMLWIFGDNVEDRMGHRWYLLFYVFCGMVASASHMLIDTGSTVPTIGASGAIAGVMGAYMVLYPRAQVLSIVPIFFFIQMIVLPAPVFLGIWFLLQFFQGTFAVISIQSAGVAWWAHIGGFVTGFLIAWLFKQSGSTTPAVKVIDPRNQRSTTYRIYVNDRRR